MCKTWPITGRETLNTPLRNCRGQRQQKDALPGLPAALSASTESVVTVPSDIHPPDDVRRPPSPYTRLLTTTNVVLHGHVLHVRVHVIPGNADLRSKILGFQPSTAGYFLEDASCVCVGLIHTLVNRMTSHSMLQHDLMKAPCTMHIDG